MVTVAMHVMILLINIFHISGFADKEDGIIYILLWTSLEDIPFSLLELGRDAFLERNCAFNNCFLTDKTTFFQDILDFDVIMFNVGRMYNDMVIPNKRSERQKYVLVAVEPAALTTVPERFNKFFNTTWTYKLNSDIQLSYIVVKNEHGEIIGPKIDMTWIDVQKMNETSLFIRNILRKKQKAAAWFVSNCLEAPSKRQEYVEELQKELKRYGQVVDVYGLCGDMYCSQHDGDECFALIESNYYFYLAFENSFCEDYVSEKILTGLEHYAVPVVYGGANYTRFMPNGIYLNARAMVPSKLADEMMSIIRDRKRYYDFFKWHGYYSFHSTSENRHHYEICGLCEFFNNKTNMNKKSIYRTNILWNEPPNGSTAPYEVKMSLIIDDEKSNTTGIAGIVSNIYNYIFDA